jgi:integrase
MVLADAVRRREIRHNPAADASPPKRRRPEAIAFSLPEAHVVLDACDAAMEPLEALAVRVALFTGMRIGEVLGLRTTDCEASTVTVAGKILEMSGTLKREKYAKTHHSRRTITIDEDLGKALKDQVRRQAAMKMKHGKAWQHPELVFTTPTGGIMRPNTLSGHFSDIVRPMEADGTLSTAGATFHSLRHTHATALLRNRVPLSVVSKRLGHKDEVITLLYYSHVMPGDDESAASTFTDAWAVAKASNVEEMSNAADA